MTIILFLVILGVLVLVHELGHFFIAKKAGVKVEEFGFGYPPRAVTLGFWKGTRFSLNWIPFGGFVKIFGENYEENAETDESSRGGAKFADVSKKWQAGILAAGVLFNIIFAWLLFTSTFIVGMPTSKENDMGLPVKNAELMIVSVLPDSPADKASLRSGDKIISISKEGKSIETLTPESVSDFIQSSKGQVILEVKRGDQNTEVKVSPEEGIAADKKIIGITMDEVGILRLNPLRAIWEGLKTTINLFYLTVLGILSLIGGAVTGTADLSQVTGPVGIVGLVGDASRLGITYLLTFTALISINLAVVNLLPFPALDGGRLVFVAIEALTRKKIKPVIAQWVNMVGFGALLLLMAIITIKDIKNLF